MPTPKRRHTSGMRDLRRSQVKAKRTKLAVCPKCNSSILPHIACSNCGYYKGKEVFDVFKKLDKKQRKAKSKELAQKDQKEE
mgnify:CR=1 FL=1